MSQIDDTNTTSFNLLLNTVLTCIRKELEKAPSATNESQQHRAIADIIRSVGGATGV
jgi:hypothetical protein